MILMMNVVTQPFPIEWTCRASKFCSNGGLTEQSLADSIGTAHQQLMTLPLSTGTFLCGRPIDYWVQDHSVQKPTRCTVHLVVLYTYMSRHDATTSGTHSFTPWTESAVTVTVGNLHHQLYQRMQLSCGSIEAAANAMMLSRPV